MNARIKKSTIITSAALLLVSVLLGSCNLPASTVAPEPTATHLAEPSQTALPATSVPPSPTSEPSPSPVPPFSLPSGYRDYTDQPTGVIISIPDSWTVTGIQEGRFAILQSYPDGKYIGGGPREAGDTKCDLNLDPDLSGPEYLKAAWENNNITTLLAESTLTLAGGETSSRYEIDSLGRSNLILAELEGRLVTLTCFGELSGFDSIAETLRIAPTP